MLSAEFFRLERGEEEGVRAWEYALPLELEDEEHVVLNTVRVLDDRSLNSS